MGDVLILGAGFSYEISQRMPLTNKLGEEVLRRVGAAGVPSPGWAFSGNYFETWLSRLAEPQPDLSDVDNAHNSAWFLQISNEIRRVVVEREHEIASTRPPWWLMKFIGIMQARNATLITLNYDTLLEHAVNSARIVDWTMATPEFVASNAILRDVPSEPPTSPTGGLTFGTPGVESSFTLMKLHGSTDWHWVSGDITGATINRWSRYGQWGSPRAENENELHQRMPGRSPFIVPPAAAKSTFYNNPVTRQLWRDASQSLAGTRPEDVVALLGYSVPATDLVMSGMLSDRLTGRVAGKVDVVNPCAEAIIGRLTEIGVAPERLQAHTGPSPIPDYVDWLESETSRRVHERLMIGTLEEMDLPLVVATSEQNGALVTGVRHSEDVAQPMELLIGSMGSLFQQLQVGGDVELPALVRANDLRDLPRSGLRVRYPSGEVTQVVDLGRYHMNIGRSPVWRVLVPAAHPFHP